MTTAQKPDDKTKLLSKTWTSQVLYSDLASGSGISPSNETGSSLKNGISSPFDDTMDEPFSRQISADKQKESETNGIVLPNDVAKRIKTSITSALSKAESLALLIKTMAIYTFAFGMASLLNYQTMTFVSQIQPCQFKYPVKEIVGDAGLVASQIEHMRLLHNVSHLQGNIHS